MIVVAAKLKAAARKGDELEAEFRKLIPKVLQDPGAVCYAVHRKADNTNEFFVYEKYENSEALKYHGSTEHFKEFSRTIGPLLDGRAEVSLYNELS